MVAQTKEVLTPEDLKRFRRDGFIVVRELFSAGEVAEIRDTFMAMSANGPVEGLSEMPRALPAGSVEEKEASTDPLRFYPRMMHPHRHADKPVGPLARRYMLDARLRPILLELLHDDPVAVQSMFYFKPPGARGQDLHQDNFYLRVKPGTCMAMWLAIDDSDEDNGGMVCVPETSDLDIACPEKADPAKSFTMEHVEPPAGKKPVPVRLRAGDVLFFNGSVIHGSYPNTSTDRFRRSLICHYVPRTSQEMSHFYIEPTTFDGELLKINSATGGGPCGTTEPAGAH